MARHATSDERALIEARLADERGLVASGPAPVCMAYPSPYRAGMSSLGFQTLYRELNEQGVGAHRAFLPDAHEPMALRWPPTRVPVLSYEEQRPLSAYPIVALSVAYELELAGLVRLLHGAGIPVRARDRGPHDPVVVIGGPLTFSNPYPLIPFADVLVLGEGESIFPQVVATLLDTPARRDAIDAALALPHCVGADHVADPDETAPELPPVATAPREKLPARSAIVTPNTELADMFLVEPERGCSRPCTFCVMRRSTGGGMRLLPGDTPVGLVPEWAKRVGLVGAAVTDHPELESIVARIVESGRGIGISSLRADRLTDTLLENLAAGGYRQITVASDGISERMRVVLDRRIKEEHLLRAAKLVSAHRFRGLKVYEMIGAPGETEDDVDELIRFATELSKIVSLTLTFSTFVAKRNTPLDGQPFLGMKGSQARLKKIRSGLRGRVTLRPQSPRWAHVEWLLARAGPEGGEAAIEAVQAGARYADWIRAFDSRPPRRPVRYGDEEAWARRKGLAAEKKPARPGSLRVVGA